MSNFNNDELNDIKKTKRSSTIAFIIAISILIILILICISAFFFARKFFFI